MSRPHVSVRNGTFLPLWHPRWHRLLARRSFRDVYHVQLRLEQLEDMTMPSSLLGGTIWDDIDLNGLREAGEPALAGQVVYLDLNQNGRLDSQLLDRSPTSLAVDVAPGLLGDFGGLTALLPVEGLPSEIQNLAVHLDLANTSADPLVVGIASPTGFEVPNFPTMFVLDPGEHFVGTFDGSSDNPVTLAARPLAAGTYRPQQFFADPRSHIFDGDPNGTWGLVFFGDPSGIDLRGWSLSLTVPEPSTASDAGGNYTFAGLDAGNYTVATVRTPADVQTAPAGNGPRTVVLAEDSQVGGVDFGVRPAADLMATSFSLVAPASAWGQSVTVNYSLTNAGAGDAGPFAVELRLSNDGTIAAGGPLLQTITVPGLAAGTSLSGAVTVILPDAPPAGFGEPVDSYLGLLVDAGNQVEERNEGNNANRGSAIDRAQLGTRTNQAITSGTGVQHMPSVAVDPTDANHLVVAYMDYSLLSTGYAGIGVAVSRDGGATWQNNPIALPVGFDGGASTPAARFDGDGNVYISFLAATFLGPDKPDLTNPSSPQRQFGFQSNNGIFVARSGDGGTTFDAPVAVTSHLYTGTDVLFETFPDLAVDTAATLPNGTPNPNYGALYQTWVRFYPAGQFPGQPDSTSGSDVMIAVSHDGGQTWATSLQDDPFGTGEAVSAIKDPDFGGDPTGSPGRGFVTFSKVTVGPEGDVYVSTFGGGDFTVYHSTDAGLTFRSPDRLNQLGIPFSPVLPFPSLFVDNFRTLSVRNIVADPSTPGRVYVVEAAQIDNAGLGGTVDAADIVFARSDDYGRTWQRIFQVGTSRDNLGELSPTDAELFVSVLNDDNNGRYTGAMTEAELAQEVVSGQALPALSVDAEGRLTVIWYDTRRDPQNHGLDVFGTVSTDGGVTFARNFRITDTTFDPDAGAFTNANGGLEFYFGDAIGVAAANGRAYAVWTDSRNGAQNIFFDNFSLTPAPDPLASRFAPNRSPETASDIGFVAGQLVVPGGTLLPGTDDNWFRITAGADGELFVAVTNKSGAGELTVEFTDDAGNPIAATLTDVLDASGIVVGKRVSLTAAAEDSFLVHVRGVSDTGIAYSMTAGSLTADLGTQVQAVQSGTIEQFGQAIYRLAAAVSGTLNVTLTAGSDVTTAFVFSILGGDAATVLSSFADGLAAGDAITLTIPVQRGDVVFLKVGGIDPDAAGGFVVSALNFDQFQTDSATSLFFPATGGPSSIATADFDRDGHLDLIVTSTDFSDPVSVLLGNGDGTFQAPRQFRVGPGLNGALTAGNREVGIGDFNGDGIPDAMIANFRSADVSVLLGRGDGTFQPQRRFDAMPSPDSLTLDDFNGDGILDALVLQNFPQLGGTSRFALLVGRGDGSFLPPVLYSTVFAQGASPIRTGDFTGDGKLDVLVLSKNNPFGQLFINTGGSFTDAGTFAVGENTFEALVFDLNVDGKLDLITTSTNSGHVYTMFGNGDGTFGLPQSYLALAPRPGDNVGVVGLTLADVGGPLGAPADGRLDLVVTAAPRSGQGAAEVILLPGLADADGNFAGFGAVRQLATTDKPGKIVAGDFDGDGVTDLAVADTGGVTAIYGRPLAVPANDTSATARDLGSVSHLITLPQAIVVGHSDAYYKLTVPTESVTGSRDQVVDIAAIFESVGSHGLQMEVLDAAGQVLGSGPRVRLLASQGAVLTIHVFGGFASASPDISRGFGAYTLDVAVLPQVVSAQAQSALPGGPSTSIVLTIQGDQLDPTAAEDPANYTVTWTGANGETRVIPVAALGGGQPVVYNPGANVTVSSGLTYPTAARQTITLLFSEALPAGSYTIAINPNVGAALYNAAEATLLPTGHPIVSVAPGAINNGSILFAPGLVAPSTGIGNLGDLKSGTAFLTQLQNDLSSLLDALLRAKGDDPSVSASITAQILASLLPGLDPTGLTPLLIIWLDPVSIDLVDAGGSRTTYSPTNGTVSNGLAQTFVEVGGAVELLVVAGLSGRFNLNVGNVGDAARGEALVLGTGTPQVTSLTSALRSGLTQFGFNVGSQVSPGVEPTPRGTPPVGGGTPVSPPVSPPGASPPPVTPGQNPGTGGTPVAQQPATGGTPSTLDAGSTTGGGSSGGSPAVPAFATLQRLFLLTGVNGANLLATAAVGLTGVNRVGSGTGSDAALNSAADSSILARPFHSDGRFEAEGEKSSTSLFWRLLGGFSFTPQGVARGILGLVQAGLEWLKSQQAAPVNPPVEKGEKPAPMPEEPEEESEEQSQADGELCEERVAMAPNPIEAGGEDFLGVLVDADAPAPTEKPKSWTTAALVIGTLAGVALTGCLHRSDSGERTEKPRMPKRHEDEEWL